MTLQDTIRNAVHQLVEISESDVFTSKDGTAFAFPTHTGLCLIGITHWKEGGDYVDIRWRVLIGEVSSSFDFRTAMGENHRCPDTPYGITLLNGKDVLTITDTYRFLLSWGLEEIQNIIKVRFGGGLATPVALPGAKPISEEFFVDAVRKYGLRGLLGR